MASNWDAVKRYQAKRDAIMLRPSAEDGKRIRSAAKAAGMSVQAFVIHAVWKYIGYEKEAQDES